MRRSAVLRIDPKWILRRKLRSPALHWLVAAALGLATLSVVGRLVAKAEADADRYGRWVVVAVSAADRPAGKLLGANDVTMTRLPAAMVPRGAMRRVPVGRRLTERTVAGEVLIASRLRGGTSRLAATIPEHWRAMMIPVPTAFLELAPGDHVDVVAPTAEAEGSESIVRDAVVLGSADGIVTIAVPDEVVPIVADAIAAATIQLALSGR